MHTRTRRETKPAESRYDDAPTRAWQYSSGTSDTSRANERAHTRTHNPWTTLGTPLPNAATRATGKHQTPPPTRNTKGDDCATAARRQRRRNAPPSEHPHGKTQQSRNVGCALRVFNIHLNDAASAANQRPKTARPGQTQELQERSRFTKWHTRATPINKWANGQYTEQRMGTHTVSLP